MSSLFGLSGFIAGVFGLEFLAITEKDFFSFRLYNIVQFHGVKINPEMHSRSLIFKNFSIYEDVLQSLGPRFSEPSIGGAPVHDIRGSEHTDRAESKDEGRPERPADFLALHDR